MLPVGQITHSIENRIRVRIPSKQRDAGYFAALATKFKNCAGVDALQVNPLTASVLIMHHADQAAITQFAEQNQLFSVAPDAPSPPLSRQIASRFGSVDQRLQSFSGGKIDLSGAAFVGLALAGLFQLLRRNVSPAGLTLLWYAASVLPKATTSHEDRNLSI